MKCAKVAKKRVVITRVAKKGVVMKRVAEKGVVSKSWLQSELLRNELSRKKLS